MSGATALEAFSGNQPEALLTTKGRLACLAVTSSLFNHQQIFHSNPFCPQPLLICLHVCGTQPFLGSGLKQMYNNLGPAGSEVVGVSIEVTSRIL